ncbi:MAG: peptidoglycan DD-metalloendopeptidase family protein [Bacteroidales bacterium]
MRLLLLVNIIFFTLSLSLNCQTKAELEAQRRKTLEEISNVDNLLKETSKEMNESLSELRIIGNKLNLRENVLKGLSEEIALLNNRIELNALAVNLMEKDLLVLRKDYEKAVLSSYRSSKGNSEIGYILSAKDFNQGYKRLKYLQQITKFRRNESEIILDLKNEVELSRKKLEADLRKVSDLKTRQEEQKSLLQGEQNRKQRIVRSLSNKEKQLQRDLEEKKRIARRIETEIARVIEEERKRSLKADMSPEQRALTDNFFENKGRLPWPVDRGVITSHFGIHNHPVLKYVTEKNSDIEITNSGNTPVKSVFKGVVASIVSIRGANMTVIIRHGKYMTVYSNLINIRVKTGDTVQTGQVIGSVYNDTENGSEAVLKFMVTEEKNELDPELWISKKN